MATKRKDWKAEWEKVSKESRKLAKRANQRLVRLEQYSEREGLSEILKFSYEKAQDYIKNNLGVGRSGKGRFKEHIKLYDITDGNSDLDELDNYKSNVQIQRNRIKAMEEFLASESSTLGVSRKGPKTKGIKALYDSRTNTVNERFLKKYGEKMSENDLKRFFESKKQAKLEEVVGSSMMFVVASVIKKQNLKSNKRELEKYFKSHIDLEKYDLKPEDIKSRKGESYKDYIDRLKKFTDYTDDKVLNKYINDALKEGINVNNIFI